MELKCGGNDRKWIRPHSTITNAITNTIPMTITTSIAIRTRKTGPIQEWTLSHLAGVVTIEEWKL